MKVRIFNETNKARPQERTEDDSRPLHRVLPKKTSWEEALARFEKTAPPAHTDFSESKTASRAPR